MTKDEAIAQEHTIVLWAGYGEHIPIRCAKCGAEGTTKNIDYIGARTLFISCSCPDYGKFEVITPKNAKELEDKMIIALIESNKQEKFINEHCESLSEIFNRLKKEGRYSFDKIKEIRSDQRAKALKLYHERR